MVFALRLSQSTVGVIVPSSCKIYKFILFIVAYLFEIKQLQLFDVQKFCIWFKKIIEWEIKWYQVKLKFLFAALPPVHSDAAAGLFVFMSDCITEYSTGRFDAFCEWELPSNDDLVPVRHTYEQFEVCSDVLTFSLMSKH